jgi:hypothetical protein
VKRSKDDIFLTITLFVVFSILNTVLLILMLKTKVRTIEKPRPGILNFEEANYISDTDASTK